MKTLILRINPVSLAIAASLGLSFTARGEPNVAGSSPAERARQGATKQEQIQGSSQNLGNDLSAMIDEYERNGLNGDEIKSLKSLQGIFTRLSTKDMEKIVTLLRSASEPKDAKATLTAIAGAYSQQKGVLVQLKQVLASYAADQEAVELAESARQLADRQAANLQAGIETAQWSLAGAKQEEGAVEASLQAQTAEEKAIAEESKIIQAKLEAFAKKSNNKEVADRFKKGVEDLAKVSPNLQAATDSLDKKKLFEAVGIEKIARDQMRQLARTIAPPREKSELLRETAETLDKLIAQQKTTLAATKDAIAKPIEEWMGEELKKKQRHGGLVQLSKKPETAGLLSLPLEKMIQAEPIKRVYQNYVATTTESLSGLEDRQGDMANQADNLSQDLDRSAKPAADLLRSAIPPMQEARVSLNGKESLAASTAEETALAAMEKAKASLGALLAAAEKADALSGDKVAELKEIQKQTQELQAQQTELAKTTATPKTPDQAAAAAQQQAALQQKAAQLQQQAAADAPAAAGALAGAAANMNQAAEAMKSPAQAAQAQNQQQQAAQNLEKAGQQLAQQINQLAQAQQALAAAEKALKDLAAIIEAEQKLQLDTAQAAPKQEKQPGPVRVLAPRQQTIQNDTIAFQKTVATPDAQQPLASASSHMGAAQGNLDQANAKLADPEEQKALADLYSIKKALEAQEQAAQAQLGTPPPADTAAAQAAADVAQAQAQLDQAMNKLDAAAAPQAAAKPLAQAAQKAGEAAAQATGLPPEANSAIQAAAQALAKATGEAAAGQKQEAKADGQKAQAALAQAAASLTQAQAGIAGTNPPQSQGPPGPPGTPGAPPTPGVPSPGDDKGSQGDGGNVQAGDQKQAAKGQFLGLPKRDRATIQQAQSEKYPQQYAAKVEQYLQNLADESTRH